MTEIVHPADCEAVPENLAADETENRVHQVWEAAMALAAERGWETVSLQDIAARAGLSFQDVFQIAPTKLHVLALFEDHINAALLRELSPAEEGESIRDRLFDLILERLDLLEPYRKAFVSILPSLSRDPVAALTLRPQALEMARLFLSGSGLDGGGLKGGVQVNVVIVLWMRTLRDWLADEDPGLAATMAGLDRRLRRVESLAQRLERVW